MSRLRYMVDKSIESSANRVPVYKRLWFRTLAFLLALMMVFSIWASGAIHIKIKAEDDQDAAAQYLIDNTPYIQQGELERLENKIQSYIPPTDLEAYYQLAGTQIAAEEYADALESIEKCLELYMGDDPLLYQDLLLKKGCLQVLLGCYEDAVFTLGKVILENPEQVDVYLVLAQIYAETGDNQNLLLALQTYKDFCPDDTQIRMLLAQLLFETGDYELALLEYDQLQQMESMSDVQTELHFLKAITYIQLEQYAQASELLAPLAETQSAISGLHYYLAVCYLSGEAYDLANNSFTKSIETGEMLQLSYYSRAVCRLMGENFDLNGAIQDLNSAIDYMGADADETIVEQAKTLLDTIQAQ